MPAPFFWLPLLAGLVGPLQDDAAPTTPLLDHAALGTALAEIADSHPDQVTKSLVETSRGGRSIELLTIGTGETNERMARPGILIVAGTDGSHAYTSGIAVSQARALASGYGSDDAVTALLDTTTVYIVARMNPDACEGRFGAPLAVVRGTGHGIDNDRDGRNGEAAGDGGLGGVEFGEAGGDGVFHAGSPSRSGAQVRRTGGDGGS